MAYCWVCHVYHKFPDSMDTFHGLSDGFVSKRGIYTQ